MAKGLDNVQFPKSLQVSEFSTPLGENSQP